MKDDFAVTEWALSSVSSSHLISQRKSNQCHCLLAPREKPFSWNIKATGHLQNPSKTDESQKIPGRVWTLGNGSTQQHQKFHQMTIKKNQSWQDPRDHSGQRSPYLMRKLKPKGWGLFLKITLISDSKAENKLKSPDSRALSRNTLTSYLSLTFWTQTLQRPLQALV